MDWLTEEEIQKAANTSLLAAVRCSKKHWRQLATATEEELKQAILAKQTDVGAAWCALCNSFNDDCNRCPICDGYGSPCAGGLPGKAADILDAWDNGIEVPHSAFVKVARALHKRLCQEEKKLLAEKKAG